MSKEIFTQHNDGYDELRRTFLNKEVKLFPNDTYWKYGIINDINPSGITIKITTVQNDQTGYKRDDVYFIPHEKAVYAIIKR